MIGAEAAGVFVDERGFVPVDKQQRTNVAHIFAIGDVVGQPMLAHKATHEGKVAAENCAGHTSTSTPPSSPQWPTPTPVAWVGVTENEAKAAGVKYGKGVFPWTASGRSLSLGRDEGLTKVLFDETTDRIIGAGIVGPSAGDLIAEAAHAIEMGSDAGGHRTDHHPHPTLSETAAMAAEAFEGTITDLYMPKSGDRARGAWWRTGGAAPSGTVPSAESPDDRGGDVAADVRAVAQRAVHRVAGEDREHVVVPGRHAVHVPLPRRGVRHPPVLHRHGGRGRQRRLDPEGIVRADVAQVRQRSAPPGSPGAVRSTQAKMRVASTAEIWVSDQYRAAEVVTATPQTARRSRSIASPPRAW